MDFLVELLKKTRSVSLRERRRPSYYLSRTTKLCQQVPSRKRLTDVDFRERFPGRTKYIRASLKATVRQRNVSGDHNVVRLHVFDNPIVGCIRSIPHELQRYQRLNRHSHPRICHHGDFKVISTSDAVHLLLDRTSIGIDEDVQQTKILCGEFLGCPELP